MISSKRIQKFMSLMLIIFASIGLVQHCLFQYNTNNRTLYAYIGIILISLINIVVLKFNFQSTVIFYGLRFLELHFIILLVVAEDATISNFFMLATLFAVACLVRGAKGPIIITIFSIINLIILVLYSFLRGSVNQIDVSLYIVDVISFVIVGIVSYLVTESSQKNFHELEHAHEEATKNNFLLNNTIAELSTLQEISKFANSVLNIKELINIINDMIIGVIGVNYCSIFLIDENTSNIYLEATNIRDKETLQNIKFKLASKYYTQFKSRGLTIVEGSVSDVQSYPNSSERDIKSFLITSLQSHRNFLGLIVIESGFDGAFEERKKNMVLTICNQVSIAIENAVIYDKMERLATIDGLTQVHNRRYFNEMCLSEFASLANSEYVSIAMIDIDNFKRVNDTYGHLLGDSVLKMVASIISSTTCASNSEDFLVARYGGEEFVVLMRNTNLQTAYNILEVVRKNIESCSVEDEGQKVKFTVSIGVAEYPSTSKDVKQILRDADTALYKAKQSGKNMVVSADILA